MCLGEIYTEADGRLVVVAGSGESFSVQVGEDPAEINSDFDNANWIDTMGDGLVTLVVSHSSDLGTVTKW